MKIIKESRFRVSNLKQHADKHHNQYINDPRFKDAKTDDDFNKIYDEIGDKLSRKTVAKSDDVSRKNRYVGFIDKRKRRVKYDKQTEDFIVFAGPETITLHKKTYDQYKNILKRDFGSEFDYNK